MSIELRTVRFPNGHVLSDIPVVRTAAKFSLPYRCLYCGAKLGSEFRSYCSDACLLAYEELPETSRVHGIITSG